MYPLPSTWADSGISYRSTADGNDLVINWNLLYANLVNLGGYYEQFIAAPPDKV